MGYPTDADLVEYLYGAGLIANPPAGRSAVWRYDRAIAAGIRRVEHATQRTFLQPAAYAKEFDAPTNRERRLFCGDHTAVTSVTYLAQAIAATEFRSGPENARDASPYALPYQWLDFWREWWAPTPWAQRGVLVVTATWGFSGDVPGDVAQAMLAAGGLSLWPQIASAQTRGGLTAAKQADASLTWGDRPLAGLRAEWETEIERVVNQYRDWTRAIT